MTRDYGEVYRPWSRLPYAGPERAFYPEDEAGLRSAYAELPGEQSVLPFAAGRTYGDTCVNPGGAIMDTRSLRSVLNLDTDSGRLRCGAGVSLGQILQLALPAGWTVPVCPGTSAVTVGGAVAHDVHGKNQAQVGSFGRWVEGLVLLRSNGERLACSPGTNPELFQATIGGLGLTGTILEVELRLMPLPSWLLQVERRRTADLREALACLRVTEDYDYGLIWADSFRPPRGQGASYLVLRARHIQGSAAQPGEQLLPRGRFSFARYAPAWTFRRASMRLFNRLYDRGGLRRLAGESSSSSPLTDFLFPQDSMHPTNHLYGRRGVRGHHSWLPRERDPEDAALLRLMEIASAPGAQSLVTVLKTFGRHSSPGMLSFSGEGTSLALGFPNEGQRGLDQLARLDAVVCEHGGKVYPAKDGRMPAGVFRASFPRWQEFAKQVDPRHSSSFWRRVSAKP